MNTDSHMATLTVSAESHPLIYLCSSVVIRGSKPLQLLRNEHPAGSRERAAIDEQEPRAECRLQRVAQDMDVARRRAALGEQHQLATVRRIDGEVDDDDRVPGRARMDEDVPDRRLAQAGGRAQLVGQRARAGEAVDDVEPAAQAGVRRVARRPALPGDALVRRHRRLAAGVVLETVAVTGIELEADEACELAAEEILGA